MYLRGILPLLPQQQQTLPLPLLLLLHHSPILTLASSEGILLYTILLS